MTTARADRTEDLVEEWGAEPWQPLELSIVLRLDGTQQVLENENALLSIVNLTDSSYEVVWMCGLRGVEDASRCRRGPYDRLPRTRSCGCVDRAVWRMHRVAVADHTNGWHTRFATSCGLDERRRSRSCAGWHCCTARIAATRPWPVRRMTEGRADQSVLTYPVIQYGDGDECLEENVRDTGLVFHRDGTGPSEENTT